MVYFFNLASFIFSVFKCFFSKQFFVRSHHEILSQGLVLATLRRQSGQPSLISVQKVHDRQSLLNWTSNVKRGKKKLGKEYHKELIENLIFIILLS